MAQMTRLRFLASVFALGAASCTSGGGNSNPMLPDAGFADSGPMPDAAPTPDAGPQVCTPDVHLGEACTTTQDCSDKCFCNGFELCMDGVCVAGEAPCADGIDCTDDLCNEDGNACTFDADDASCGDGNVCNGAERCVPFAGCRPGLRMTCTSTDPCQIGRCDATAGCTFELRDLDADGHADNRCGGDDCFDDPADGATVFPGATEVCGNGRDDNCNSQVDYREASCLGTNDSCATAEMLPGAGIYVRTTRGLVGD